MRQLKQNLFWVGVGLAGAALVAFYLLGVMPLGAQASKYQGAIRTKLNQLNDPVPGDPDIENWTSYRERLQKDYADISRFYQECDAHLERWFSGLPDKPNRGAFMTRYSDESRKIEEDLKNFRDPNDPRYEGVKIGIETEGDAKAVSGGFNWERPSPDDWDKIGFVPEDIERVLKTLQKRFWIRQRVADVTLAGKVKVSRVLDFRFLRRLHDRITGAPWQNPAPGNPVPPFAAMGASPPSEYDLPDELGRTITFRFGVDLPFSEIPRFIQEFLNPSAQGSTRERLLVSITQCHVTIRKQNEPEAKIIYPQGDLEQKKQKEEEARKKAAAKDVTLVLTCQVIDFDPSKVKKFGEAGAPPNP